MGDSVKTMVPNSPVAKMEEIIRRYWGKSVGSKTDKISLNSVVFDTFEITVALTGSEALVRSMTVERSTNYDFGELRPISFGGLDVFIERIQKALEETNAAATDRANQAQVLLARLGQPYEYNDQGIISWDSEQWLLALLVLQVVRLPSQNALDFLVLWVGRELKDIAKAVANSLANERYQQAKVLGRDYTNAAMALRSKAPAIAQWAKETRTDIGKVNIAQALEAIATYKFKTSLVEQGPVVYTFKDEWTVQELRTELALSQEGNNMQNCIAGYFDAVMDNTTRIYSIRDASGAPHVSMELVIPGGVTRAQASDMSPEEFIESRTRLDCYFAQILGKQNDMPIDEYRARAREFIDKVFDKEGLGWVIAGGTPTWGRFEGRKWQNVDFPDVLGTNHVSEDVLAETIFADATVDRCKFVGLVGPKSFRRAEISETSFQGTVLHEADFEGVKGYFVDFRSAVLSDASFDSAHLGGSDFRRSTIGGANFRDARVDGVKFDGAQGGESANWENVELTTAQKGQLGLP